MVSDDKYNDPSPLHATLGDNLSVNSLELYGNLYRQNIIIIIILVTTIFTEHFLLKKILALAIGVRMERLTNMLKVLLSLEISEHIGVFSRFLVFFLVFFCQTIENNGNP